MLRFLCNFADEKEEALPCGPKTVRLVRIALVVQVLGKIGVQRS